LAIETPVSPLIGSVNVKLRPAVDPYEIQRIDIETRLLYNEPLGAALEPGLAPQFANLLVKELTGTALGEAHMGNDHGFCTVGFYDQITGELTIDVHLGFAPSSENSAGQEVTEPIQSVTIYENRDNLPLSRFKNHLDALLTVTVSVYNLAHEIAGYKPPTVAFELNKDTELQ
jgi:hypothetical protein